MNPDYIDAKPETLVINLDEESKRIIIDVKTNEYKILAPAPRYIWENGEWKQIQKPSKYDQRRS